MSEPKKVVHTDDVDPSVINRVMRAALSSRKYMLTLALQELAKMRIEDSLADVGKSIVREENDRRSS